MKIGIEIALDDNLPEPKLTPSPVATDEKDDNVLWLNYRADVEALNNWVTVALFMRRSIRFVLQEPDLLDNFNEFLIIRYGSNCEKRVLGYQTMIKGNFNRQSLVMVT